MENIDQLQAQRCGGPKSGSRYRHYKGGEYQVLGNVIHESTHEHLVTYKDDEGNTWARPFAQWNEEVEVDGQKMPRFTPVPDSEA